MSSMLSLRYSVEIACGKRCGLTSVSLGDWKRKNPRMLLGFFLVSIRVVRGVRLLLVVLRPAVALCVGGIRITRRLRIRILAVRIHLVGLRVVRTARLRIVVRVLIIVVVVLIRSADRLRGVVVALVGVRRIHGDAYDARLCLREAERVEHVRAGGEGGLHGGGVRIPRLRGKTRGEGVRAARSTADICDIK